MAAVTLKPASVHISTIIPPEIGDVALPPSLTPESVVNDGEILKRDLQEKIFGLVYPIIGVRGLAALIGEYSAGEYSAEDFPLTTFEIKYPLSVSSILSLKIAREEYQLRFESNISGTYSSFRDSLKNTKMELTNQIVLDNSVVITRRMDAHKHARLITFFGTTVYFGTEFGSHLFITHPSKSSVEVKITSKEHKLEQDSSSKDYTLTNIP